MGDSVIISVRRVLKMDPYPTLTKLGFAVVTAVSENSFSLCLLICYRVNESWKWTLVI